MSRISLKTAIVLLGAAALTALVCANASAVCANLSTDFVATGPTGSMVAPFDVDSDGYNDSFVFFVVAINGAPGAVDANITMTLESSDGSVVYTSESGTFSVPGSGYVGSSSLLNLATSDLSGEWMASYRLTELTGPAPQDFCEGRAWLADLFPTGDYQPEIYSVVAGQLVEQNASVNYDVRITNGGNLPDTVNVSFASLRGWQVNNGTNSFDLNPGEFVDIVITVHAPQSEAPGTSETTTLTVVSKRNPSSTAAAAVQTSVAAQVFAAAVSAGVVTGSGAPGTTVPFDLTVTNNGNNRDAIYLAGSVSTNGWSLTFGAPFGPLDAGQSVVVRVTVNVPLPVTAMGSWEPTITVFSQDDTPSESVTLNITSLYADFHVEESDIAVTAGTISAGDPVAINVTVHNRGPAAAANVSVAVQVGTAFAHFGVIASIAAGGSARIGATWNATAGDTAVFVTVDGGNLFPEFSETDNTAAKQVQVNRRPTAALSGPASTSAGVGLTFSAANSTDGDGQVTAYFFDFGDGTNSGWVLSDSALHNYSSGGNFAVTVRVRDDHDVESSNAASIEVHVNARPTAAVVAPAAATTGVAVNISANGSADTDGTVASYYFDFGDGTNSGWVATPSVAHTYNAAGNFTVRIRVQDNASAESGDATAVIVASAPAPPPPPPAGGFLPGFGADVALLAASVVGLALVAARRRRSR